MENPSSEPPKRRGPKSEVLAPYEETIDSWLDDDRGNWRKQHHTATRVYVRLRDEQGCTGGRPNMQRHVKRRRKEMARERDRKDAEGFLTLRWQPGEAPGPGRVRLRARRRGWGEAPVPGHIGQLWGRSVIFTTNVEVSRWGTVFAGDELAAAIVDRVVHHGRLVEFGGPSNRLEESLMLGKSRK